MTGVTETDARAAICNLVAAAAVKTVGMPNDAAWNLIIVALSVAWLGNRDQFKLRPVAWDVRRLLKPIARQTPDRELLLGTAWELADKLLF